jgi:hypothetical protein
LRVVKRLARVPEEAVDLGVAAENVLAALAAANAAQHVGLAALLVQVEKARIVKRGHAHSCSQRSRRSRRSSRCRYVAQLRIDVGLLAVQHSEPVVQQHGRLHLGVTPTDRQLSTAHASIRRCSAIRIGTDNRQQ